MTNSNVIVLSLDSLRADHLSTYGYGRATSPALTAFGERADVTVFENAFATTAWTLPSHTSLFTGLPTIQHGLYDKGYRINPQYTLAAQLNDKGYDTAAFLNNGWLTKGGIIDTFDTIFEIFNMDTSTGFFERNLNRLENLFSFQDSGVTQTFETFYQWMKEGGRNNPCTDSKPFFAFFHLMEPHYLYNPRRPYHKEYTDQSVMRLLVKQREIYTDRGKYFAGGTSISDREMQGFVDLYDSEIRYLDSKISELFEYLRSTEFFEDSLIIVLGDHGEHFGEHDLIGHHFSLSEELLHVPLFVKWPNSEQPIEADRSDSFVSLSDVFKTITKVIGSESSDKFERLSLINKHNEGNKFAYAHYRTPESMLNSFREQITSDSFSYRDEFDTEISMIRKGSEKLITTPEETYLYDFKESDGTVDFSDERKGRVNELRKELESHQDYPSLSNQSKGSRGFSEGVQQQLKDLGYI